MDSLPPASPLKVSSLDKARAAQDDLLVIGVVGAVGSGTSWTARVLKRLLRNRKTPAEIVTARSGLERAAGARWEEAIRLKPTEPVRSATTLQAIGDELRQRNDNAFVASAMIARIVELLDSAERPKVVICDSLRHPDEARLLRMVYGDAFWLLGTVCDLAVRKERLRKKLKAENGVAPPELELQEFIDRDEDDPERKHGQHVAATFEMADYFVDTSPSLSDPEAADSEISEWPVTRDLARFLDLVRADRPMLRPTDAEQAMYHAYAARLGSACLSRQVGAALIDRNGQLLATGCNEVPRAGGGLYGQGEGDETERERGRCHVLNGYCSNTVERNAIVDDVMKLLEREDIALPKDGEEREALRKKLRRSRLGQLIEFSRSVHAEMDALVSAARKGVSTVGGRLFVTTFPCHNCARHIVAAGIDEVQFIEPYVKSKALALHADSITQSTKDWDRPSAVRQRGAGEQRVLFRPYVGAAPRLYRRAFVKEAEVKNSDTGQFLPDAKAVRAQRLRPLSKGFDDLQRQIAADFEKALTGQAPPFVPEEVSSASP